MTGKVNPAAFCHAFDNTVYGRLLTHEAVNMETTFKLLDLPELFLCIWEWR
jgi:hypothetical protein